VLSGRHGSFRQAVSEWQLIAHFGRRSSRREGSLLIATAGVAVGRVAVLDRLNPHEHGFLVVLLLDGGVASSQIPNRPNTSAFLLRRCDQRTLSGSVDREHRGVAEAGRGARRKLWIRRSGRVDRRMARNPAAVGLSISVVVQASRSRVILLHLGTLSSSAAGKPSKRRPIHF
jgi:hypothetical protein